VNKQDIARLRDLAAQVREIAALPVQEKRRRQWRALNDLNMIKPMVYTRDYQWPMVTADGEMTPAIADEFLQKLELQLMGTLFKWNRLQADMVVDPVVFCQADVVNRSPVCYKVLSAGSQEAVLSPVRDNLDSTAVRYVRRIETADDLERVIPMPDIYVDQARLEREYNLAEEIFDGILPVEKTGVSRIDYTPWDDLCKLFGIEEGLMGLYLEPELMHQAIGRYTDVHLELVRQYEEAGILQHNNGNYLVGSGALGYTSDLPGESGPGARSADCWGFCADQIFTSVSPELHDEFATRHEIRWMDRFGLSYYGCCERLDHKLGLLGQFRNLRKISISPFSELERAMEIIGGQYVVSWKPNSTLLAGPVWDREASRRELVNACRLAQKYNCNMEIVMKTMITLNSEPQRLWQWCAMAAEITGNI
jgi:hypothetical protein